MHWDGIWLYHSTSPKSQAKKVNWLFFKEFCKLYEATYVPRCPKRPVRRPKKNPQTTSQMSEESQQTSKEELTVSKRSAYRVYSLRQKLEIVCYAHQNSEAAASWHFVVSRSTFTGGGTSTRNLSRKFLLSLKKNHLKKGGGRPISYPQELDEELLAWVLQQRDLQLIVRWLDIQLKATALIAPDHPSFNACFLWLGQQVHVSSLPINQICV